VTLANRFTTARVVSAPLFYIVYSLPAWTGRFAALSAIVIAPLFALAELTDYFDGHAARRAGQVSAFGKIYDPFADVMLNLSAFLALAVSGHMPALALALILYREFSMTFLRAAAAERGLAIGARKGGKAKTVTYVLSISWALALECALRLGLLETIPPALKTVETALFCLCVVFSYVSFADYLVQFKETLWNKPKHQAAGLS